MNIKLAAPETKVPDMTIDTMLQSRALKKFFKESAARGDKEIYLSFSKVERLIGKKLPNLAKSKGAEEIHWNDHSLISYQWRKFGYSISNYDLDKGGMTFNKSEGVEEAYRETKKALNAAFKEELTDLSRRGFKPFLFYAVLTGIVALGAKSCSDSIESSSDPCSKLGLQSNWNGRECR